MTFDEYRSEIYRSAAALITKGAFDSLAPNRLAMEEIWSDERVTGSHVGEPVESQIVAAHCIVGSLDDFILTEQLEQLEIDLADYDSDIVALDRLIRSLAFQLEWESIEELWLRRVSMLASVSAGEPVYLLDQIPAPAHTRPRPSASIEQPVLYDSSGFPIGNLTSFI